MMYTISKRMEISAAHKLDLPYESKCVNLHGHNYIVYVHCIATELTDEGMVVDFAHVKKNIHEKLDHHYLNDILNTNPTAENMAEWIMDEINKDLKTTNRYAQCYRVDVQESEGNMSTALNGIVNFHIMDEMNVRTYLGIGE